MGTWAETLHYFTRMIGIADTKFDDVGDITEASLRELSEVDLADIRRGLSSEEAFMALDAATKARIVSLLGSFEMVVEGLARHGTYRGLEIGDILEVTAEGVTKIKVPYLNDAFRSWRGQLVRDFNLAKENPLSGFRGSTFAEYLAFKNIALPDDVAEGIDPLVVAYIRRTRGGESVVSRFFRLLLKENYDLPVRSRRIVQRARDGWGMLHYMTLPRLATTNTLDEVADIAKSATRLKDSVDEAIEHINALVNAGRIDLPDDFVRLLNSTDSEIKGLLVQKISAILNKFPAESGQVTAESIAKLVGQGRNVPGDQIIGEIVVGFGYLFKELDTVKRAYGLTDGQAEKALEIFLKIEGVEDFFGRLLRRVDHDHAYIFEQLIPLSIIAKALKEGKELDPAFMFIQTTIGTRQASDLLVMAVKEISQTMRNGSVAVREVLVFLNIQMKSFLDLGKIIRNSDHGEAIRQTTSTLDRMMREGMILSSDRAALVDVVFHNVMEFKVNWNRLRLNPTGATIDAIIRRMPEELQGRARSLDPSEFFAQIDDVLGPAIRQAFHAEYVQPVINTVNRTLINYPQTWASRIVRGEGGVFAREIIRERVIEHMGLAKNPPSPGESRYAYMRIINFIDQGRPVEEIEEALVTAFRQTFALSDGEHIQIVIDLVEGAVNNSVTDLITRS